MLKLVIRRGDMATDSVSSDLYNDRDERDEEIDVDD